jgi:hypothetical protein
MREGAGGIPFPASCHLVELRGLLSVVPEGIPSALDGGWPWQSSIAQKAHGRGEHRWRMRVSRERSRDLCTRSGDDGMFEPSDRMNILLGDSVAGEGSDL